MHYPQPRTKLSRDPAHKDLRAILADGAFFSLMVGLGETYVAAFALALRASEIAAGLLAAVPMMAGGVLQLASPWTVQRLGSHRRWVVSCATWQATSLLVLPIAVLCGRWAIWLIFSATTVYWGMGLATGPAWNTWIEEIVPKRVRTQFFAHRVRISQLCVLVGFASGGLWLEAGEAGGWPLAAFVMLFLMAGACRLASAACLASQSEPSAGAIAANHVGLRELSRRLRCHPAASLLGYLLAIQLAVQMAGPYFAPFMLAQLDLTYTQYMLLVACGYLGKVIALPMWGRLAHRSHAQALLWIGGLTIIPLSGLWLGLYFIERMMLYLAAVQVLGGIAWAAYELAAFLLFFEAIPREERTSMLTIFNFGHAVAMVAGAALGAIWLACVGDGRSAYLELFGISSAARLAALALLVRVPNIRVAAVPPAIRTIAVRPSDDSTLDGPILPSIPNGVENTER
jgi:MFS family permease